MLAVFTRRPLMRPLALFPSGFPSPHLPLSRCVFQGQIHQYHSEDGGDAEKLVPQRQTPRPPGRHADRGGRSHQEAQGKVAKGNGEGGGELHCCVRPPLTHTHTHTSQADRARRQGHMAVTQ